MTVTPGNLEKIKKLLRFKQDKDLATFQEIERLGDELKGQKEILTEIAEAAKKKSESEIEIEIDRAELVGEKGDTPTDDELLALIRPLIPAPEKGDRGDDGKTPTETELLALIRPLIPQVKDGETPTDDRLLRLIRPLIPPPIPGEPGKDGEDGEDGSPDTPSEIRDKLQSLKGSARLDARAIKNLPHGGGGSGSSSGVSDHGELDGLTDDDHSQYALLAGRSGGQTLIGGTASGDDLTFKSTSHATLGTIIFESTGATGMNLSQNAVGIGRLILGGNVDPTDSLFAGGVTQFFIESASAVGTSFGAWYAGDGAGGVGAGFAAVRSRGTLAVATTTLDGDLIFKIDAFGWGTDNVLAGSGGNGVGGIRFFQDGDAGATVAPGRIQFLTTNQSGVSDDRINIRHNGLVGIGDSLVSPGARLHVKGTGTTEITTIFQAVASQSANITEWQNSAAGVLASLSKDGFFTGPKVTTDDLIVNKSAYFDAEFDNGNSGTADTIDWTVGNKQKSTRTGSVEYTFTAPAGPCNLVLRLVHENSASVYTVTWPATVKWVGGVAPTLTDTANAIDVVCFYYDGTNYYGQAAANFS